ncbi:TIGR02452 family protein [Paenibacillus sp. GCM10027627]|uniref:TIGR02452 family protein n=1 Tax=unclassified Paenibacillus TaxID=185978 RepID=UPI00362B3165
MSILQSEAVAASRLYRPEQSDAMLQTDFVKHGEQTVIELTGETTLEAASRLAASGEGAVCGLNFASAKNPGGGFLNGTRAQEESLARSSGLYPAIAQMES